MWTNHLKSLWIEPLLKQFVASRLDCFIEEKGTSWSKSPDSCVFCEECGHSHAVQTVWRLFETVSLSQVIINLTVFHAGVRSLTPRGDLPHGDAKRPLTETEQKERERKGVRRRERERERGKGLNSFRFYALFHKHESALVKHQLRK